MIDINIIRESPERVIEDLKKRGMEERIPLVEEIRALDEKWRKTVTRLNQLRAERNKLTREIAGGKRELIEKAREVDREIEGLEEEERRLREMIRERMLRIPNLTHESVPPGGEDDAVPVRFWGKARVWEGHLERFKEESLGKMEYEVLDWRPKHHADLVVDLGIADLERGAKVAGSRLCYIKGAGEKLQSALIQYALEVLEKEGFQLFYPPMLVREFAMEGTGFLPEFAEDIYKVEGEDLYLIGTAEVALAAYHANEILDENDLPLKYAGISSCFRTEAGSHGKDTKGIFRIHQFEKVEMYVYTTPEDSWNMHEYMIGVHEKIIQGLEIPYRIVNIAAGDLGFSAAKKYDLEAWFPGQGKFRELASGSNTTDYQTRRLNVRIRKNPGEKPRYAHSLNCTAIAVQRTITAILSAHQREDGSVRIPRVLWKYGAPKELAPQ